MWTLEHRLHSRTYGKQTMLNVDRGETIMSVTWRVIGSDAWGGTVTINEHLTAENAAALRESLMDNGLDVRVEAEEPEKADESPEVRGEPSVNRSWESTGSEADIPALP
jgi:hypothetical protein